MRKRKSNIIYIFIFCTLLTFCFLSRPLSLIAKETSKDQPRMLCNIFEEELESINCIIKNEISGLNVSENQTLMKEQEIEEWDINDVVNFLEQTDEPEVMLEYMEEIYMTEGTGIGTYGLDVPPSTDKIQFYAVRKNVDGVWVYSIIASPVENMAHSCNTVKKVTNMKEKIINLNTFIQIYANKAIGTIPIIKFLPYEVFSDLIFNGTSKEQLASLETTLITRTVHQFIYVENSRGVYSYYGSANCVHVNTENIARKYNHGKLETSVYNTYNLVVAPDYYNWAEVCTNGNLTGYNVVQKYSFIQGITIKAGNNVISQSVVNARNLIQVAS